MSTVQHASQGVREMSFDAVAGTVADLVAEGVVTVLSEELLRPDRSNTGKVQPWRIPPLGEKNFANELLHRDAAKRWRYLLDR